MPSGGAATLGRDLLSEAKRMFSPLPGSPMRFARGTLQLSKARLAVVDSRLPIFFSTQSTSSPGVPFSNTSTEMAAFGSSIPHPLQLGRAACREGVWKYGERWVVAVSLKQK